MFSKRYFRILPALLIFFGFTCTLKSPEAPSFESNLSIPVTSKSFYMWKLAEQEKNLYADEKNFGFTIQGTLDTVFVADHLKSDDPLTDAGLFLLGPFSLNYSDTLIDSSHSLSVLWPPAAMNQGKEIPVLPFQFDMTFENANASLSSRYATIEIDSGLAFIEIENRLGFALGESLAVTLGCRKSNSSVEIGTVHWEAGKPAQIDLSHQEITSQIFVRIQGTSPGSGTRLVKIDSLKQKLILRLGFSQIRARSAFGQIPILPLKKSDWLYLTDETDQISMIEARFTKAELVLRVKSYLNLDSHFDLISNHLFDTENSRLSIPIHLSKHDSVTISKPLDNWLLKTDLSEGLNRPKIDIYTNGFTEATGDQMEVVTSRDSIVVEARIINPEMEYVNGTINHLLIEMDSTRKKLELDYELPNLKFKNTELQLNIYNQIAFPVELNLSFVAERNSKPLERYEFRQRIIEPAGVVAGQEQSQEKLTTFFITDDRFNNLMNVIPEFISISGAASVGQWGTIGQIRQRDFLYGTYSFKAPFDICFEDTCINLDTTYIQINPSGWQEPKQKYIDHEIEADLTRKLLDGRFLAYIENHLPIAAEAVIKIDSSFSSLFSSGKKLLEKRIGLLAGEISEMGHVHRAAIDTLQFDLTADELAWFKNPSQKPRTLIILIQFHLTGTKGRYVKIFRDDYLSIKESYFIFRYPFHPQ